jgi:VCBS repeat-containing protein
MNDTDVDAGDTKTIVAVNDQAAAVGTQITLASGALLIVHADGSYQYDPNGKYESLRAGQTATDEFTYTVVDSAGATSCATVEQLRTRLHAWRKEVGAQMPTPNSNFDRAKPEYTPPQRKQKATK